MLTLLLTKAAKSHEIIKVNRLVQIGAVKNKTNARGSHRVNIDAMISSIESVPSKNGAVFVDIENVDLQKLSGHINKSAPIIFNVPNKPVDTKELEKFLIGTSHSAPIYFAYNQKIDTTGFSNVKIAKNPSNSAIKKTYMQNIIGTMNSSKTFNWERIAIITAPYDSFNIVPTSKTGANSAIGIAAVLEIMRIMAAHPIRNNWCFIFALVDGHYCNKDGLIRFVNKLGEQHGSKVEFAISLDNIADETLSGYFSTKLQRRSSFHLFLRCLNNAFKSVGLDLNDETSNAPHNHLIFRERMWKSLTIAGENSELSGISDFTPNTERATKIAWAVSNALLTMMYDTDDTAMMVPYSSVNTTLLAETMMTPRMPQFRDRTLSSFISDWMAKFGSASIDEWSSTQCNHVHSATDAELVLYNKFDALGSLTIYGAAAAYVIVAYFVFTKLIF